MELFVENEDLKNEELEDDIVYVIDLEPKDFENNLYILNKYFQFKNHSLDRFHIPELTEEDFNEVVSQNPKIVGKKSSNMHFDTASEYIKKKIVQAIVAKDLEIPIYNLSLEGYKWSDDWYEFSDYDDNVRYIEDKFREESKDRREITTYEIYIGSECYDKGNVDLIAYYKLYLFCIEAVKNRLAMLYEVSTALSLLERILKDSEGFTRNITQTEAEELKTVYASCKKKQDSKEYQDWIKSGHNDYTMYGNGYTASDYIETYKKILKKLEGIPTSKSGDIEFYKEIIHNEADTLEEQILNDDIEYDEVYYFENSYDSNEDEEDNCEEECIEGGENEVCETED